MSRESQRDEREIASRIGRAQREIVIHVTLTDAIATQVEEVQKVDPEFLSRVVLYGITRRSIYRHLREADDAEAEEAPDEEGGTRGAGLGLPETPGG